MYHREMSDMREMEHIGFVGLGYVGPPVAIDFAKPRTDARRNGHSHAMCKGMR